MFAIPGILLLVVQSSTRSPGPLFALGTALALFGLAVDVRLRHSKLSAAPQLGWVALLGAWSLFLGWPGGQGGHAWQGGPAAALVPPLVLFVLLAHGVQSFRALALVAATILALALLLAAARLLDVPSLPVAHLDGPQLTLTLIVGLPLVFALFARQRPASRLLLRLGALALIGTCVVMSYAPGGGAGALLQTQSNSYARIRAGLGLPGFALWSATLYLSFKLLLVALRRYASDANAAVARAWARALLTSLGLLSVGAAFQPLGDHVVLWSYLGLVGAFYQACRAHDPELRVRFDRHDLLRLVAIDLAVLVALYAFCA